MEVGSFVVISNSYRKWYMYNSDKLPGWVYGEYAYPLRNSIGVVTCVDHHLARIGKVLCGVYFPKEKRSIIIEAGGLKTISDLCRGK